MSLNRRRFNQLAGLSVTTVMAGTQPKFSRARSADKVRVAAIGFGGRGKQLIRAVRAAKNAELVALADVDSKTLEKVEANDQSLIRTADFRELLKRDDIDAIVSATPNHWHALITVLALESGKHVYMEKPVSHNIAESNAIVAASEKNKRWVQCGFQNRSDTGLLPFFKRLHAGEFGKVTEVHGTCFRARASIGKLESPLKIPTHINYDLWLGPAADQPVLRPRLHYDWHWDFNTGNGDVGNQGPHEWDMINWALGDPATLPSSMVAAGNRFGWNDAGNTPNVMGCLGEMNGIPIFFEVMDLNPGERPPYGRGVGVIIQTEAGMFVGGRGGGKFQHKNGKSESFQRDETQKNTDGTFSHMQNFIDAVVQDDRSLLRSDCRVGARSSSMAHMANVSYQLGQEGKSADIEAVITKTTTGRKMLGRLRESTKTFAAKNGIKVQPWLLGKSLNFDGTQFVGSHADTANQKMTRAYRAGYEFPKQYVGNP